MCHLATCPNDGKKTWWGCGEGAEGALTAGRHVDAVMRSIPAEEQCDCEHEAVPWLPFMKRVKVKAGDTVGQEDKKGQEL